MSDNLKNFVNDPSNDFDVYPFDVSEGWDDIKHKIHPPKTNYKTVFMSVAASISILLLAGLGYMSLSQTSSNGFQTELAETKFYYEQQIDARLTELRSQVDDQALFEDLDAMDKAFAELKADLEDGAQNEQLIEAMIENYRLKLEILEKILNDLEAESDEENINI